MLALGTPRQEDHEFYSKILSPKNSAKLFHCETILRSYMLGLVQGITLIRK